MNICQHLSGPARIFPDRWAIIFESHAITYEELDLQSAAAADCLRRSGVTAGDRVAIMLPNVPAFAVWYYGALRLGAIAVSLSTRLASAEIEFVVQDCQAETMVVLAPTNAPPNQPSNGSAKELQKESQKESADFPSGVKNVFAVSELGNLCNDRSLDIPENRTTNDVPIYCARPDEPALILYTSGTTGFPKGATLSHGNVNSNVCAFNHLCQMSFDDVILLTVPLFHCFGQNALLNSGLNAGATLVLQKKFDPQASKRLIADHRVTQLYGVPAMFQMLNDCCTEDDLRSVYYCFTAASTMPIQVAQKWQSTYKIPIHEGYGLTETSPFASYNHRLKFVPGSIGMPIDNVEMKIVDSETKQTCSPGELGEIAIRGPNVMLGYWNRPDDTAEAIVDGWFYSGDIGRIDDEGYFYIVDRVKDMISIGGLKVYPAEVERILLDHPRVAQAAVVGFSGGVLGEEVAAFVVVNELESSNDQSTDDDNEVNHASAISTDDNDRQWALVNQLKAYSRDHLANYKTPKYFFIVDELPRNPSGKVLKTELRDRQQSLLSSKVISADQPSGDEIASPELGIQSRPPQLRTLLEQAYPTERQRVSNSYLQQVIGHITGDDQTLQPDQGLLESGLDSLMLVELSHQLQVEMGDSADISATVIFDYPTIDQLSEFLIQRMFSENQNQNQADADAEATQLVMEPQSPDLESTIAAMPEDEVLEALLKELDDESES